MLEVEVLVEVVAVVYGRGLVGGGGGSGTGISRGGARLILFTF